MRIVGCFLEFEGKFVIVLRHPHKPEGDTWGLPGGKVEAGEQDEDAVLRELAEETGYRAARSELEHLGDFDFVSSAGEPYTYATFCVHLQNAHEMQLEEAAHADYKWTTAQGCYAKQDLIPGFHELLKLVGYVKAD